MKGKIKIYLSLPLILIGLLVVMNIFIWKINHHAGMVMGGFVLFYSIVCTSAYVYYKARLSKELIDYATNFGKVQKKMLNELEVAYVITDPHGKVLWGNGEFHHISGVEKGSIKSISGICTNITKEFLDKIKK